MSLQENVKVTRNTTTKGAIDTAPLPGGTPATDDANTVTNGGGIYVEKEGTVNLQGNVEISGNTAENGGGIYVANDGTVTIQDNVKITGNSANVEFTETTTDTATGGNVSGSYTGGVAGYNFGAGTIENCYNAGSVSASASGSGSYSFSTAGGICGINDGTIENRRNDGSGSASGSGSYSSSPAGGICGINNGTIENCYNTGSVSASASGSGSYSSSTAGGVCGHNYNTVKNCLNTGKVSTSGSSASSGYAGGVCGDNSPGQAGGGTVTNCYYQESDNLPGIGGNGTDQSGATAKTSTELASGEVAFLLNVNNETRPWRQNLDNGETEDTYPVLDASHGEVYKITKDDGRTWYSNSKNISDCTVTLSQTTFTYNGQEQRPTVTAVEVDGETLEGGTDYTVTYPESSVNAGEYTITITGTGKYTGTVTVTYTIKAAEPEPEPEPEPTPTPTPPPYVPPYIPPTKPDGPSTGTSDGWEDIREEIADADKGDTITIDMGDETEVPGEIFEEVAGKDVTVEFELEDGISWAVNGQDVPEDIRFADLDLGVDLGTSGISVDVINTVTGELGSVQITLAHDGEFGFALTLTAPLGRENAGYWANLYHYDEAGETLNFETGAQVASDGTASLRMTHASQYAIVIDDKSHQLPFTDLGENQWYEPAVRYAYTHGIMEGMSATKFSPNTSLTRAEAVQVLYNLEGQPTVSGNAAFPDLVEKWYKPAIAWAEQTGVVDGYEDGTFRPGQPVNRMEFAQMLYNYAAYKGYDLTAKGDLTTFPDGSEVQEWALPAMTWANGNELINGHDDGTLEPGGTTTRAQAAAILMRFDQNLAE